MDASQIRSHMRVVGSDRQPVGTVDGVENDRIKLTKNDPQAKGQHHFIPMQWVDRVDGQDVCLTQTAADAQSQWQS